MATNPNAAPEPFDFSCPRCHTTVAESYYGPCGSCCAELRATQALGMKNDVVADYVPKMNVTPNAVASKE